MTATPGLSARQSELLDLLQAEPRRGFDLAELAHRLSTSPEGAAKTAASLRRRGLADRFVGGVGRQRVHYQAAEAAP